MVVWQGKTVGLTIPTLCSIPALRNPSLHSAAAARILPYLFILLFQ